MGCMRVIEPTLIMIKPEAVGRGLMGRILGKFEDAGLRVERIQKFKSKKNILRKHYMYDPGWFAKVGQEAVDQFRNRKTNIIKYLGTKDPMKIGEHIYRWHIRDLQNQEVVVAILSGPHAIRRVIQLVGSTEPIEAGRGTIRGDWCTDSIIYANIQARSIMNLVHRSSTPEEYMREKQAWFG